jgi:predicted DNA-binding transcriptional regulator AlpA
MTKHTPTPTRTVEPTGKLAGLAEVAEIAGVSTRTAWAYTLRVDFPKPIDYLSTGPVWRRSAVERWAEKTLPLAVGRPRKGSRRE